MPFLQLVFIPIIQDNVVIIFSHNYHSYLFIRISSYRIREKRIRLPTKRRYLVYSSRVSYSSIDSTEEEMKCQHKPLHRDTWTACPRRIEQ